MPVRRAGPAPAPAPASRSPPRCAQRAAGSEPVPAGDSAIRPQASRPGGMQPAPCVTPVPAPPPCAPVKAAMTRDGRGFTLIELLVTLAILALLGTLVVPVAQVTVQRRQEQELRRALREIRRASTPTRRPTTKAASPWSTAPAIRRAWTCWSRACPTCAARSAPRCTSCAACRATRSAAIPRPARPQTWGKRSYASEAADPRGRGRVRCVFAVDRKVGLNDIPYRKW
jgi:general secretion pathway protein G